jgi:hypothetical protein
MIDNPRCAILAVMDDPRSVTKGAVDARLRFRVWIAGRLAAEHWFDALNIDPAEVGEVAAEHGALAADADHRGLPWLLEVYDPAQNCGHEYIRWGTDQAGMGDPCELQPGDLDAAVLGLFDALAEGDDGARP